jgi:hypothetical protein
MTITPWRIALNAIQFFNPAGEGSDMPSTIYWQVVTALFDG